MEQPIDWDEILSSPLNSLTREILRESARSEPSKADLIHLDVLMYTTNELIKTGRTVKFLGFILMLIELRKLQLTAQLDGINRSVDELIAIAKESGLSGKVSDDPVIASRRMLLIKTGSIEPIDSKLRRYYDPESLMDTHLSVLEKTADELDNARTSPFLGAIVRLLKLRRMQISTDSIIDKIVAWLSADDRHK